jgi:hypothetical protein
MAAVTDTQHAIYTERPAFTQEQLDAAKLLTPSDYRRMYEAAQLRQFGESDAGRPNRAQRRQQRFGGARRRNH